MMGNRWSTYGPTPTHRESLRIARQGLSDVSDAMERLYETDLPRLRERLDAAGVPWTPGRRAAE